jgi:AbrB family looped-hinge helix DNA binding protein
MKSLGDSKVSSKFQVTVTKAARDILGLAPGDLVVFLVNDHQVLLKKGEIRALESKWRETN